jgi:cytochrome oxidase Cu insertion factor (SCO1/SenC/PrrC family)
MKRHVVRGLLAALGLQLLAWTAGVSAKPTGSERSAAELMDVLMWNKEPVGGPFSLVDHTGQPRTEADFRGKWLVIYFGYTHCPDICPTDLQAIAQAVDQLGLAGEAVQPLFITVDPERDTIGHLAEYIPLFHPRLVGLTGTPEAIRRAAVAYKVFYTRASATPSQDYGVDHTAFIYLVDPAGQYVGFLPPGTSAGRLEQILRQHLSTGAKIIPNP